jgi:hypothetical protein
MNNSLKGAQGMNQLGFITSAHTCAGRNFTAPKSLIQRSHTLKKSDVAAKGKSGPIASTLLV